MHKAWKVLIVCCGMASASMGLLANSVGVFFGPVSEALGVMKGSFALHITIGLVAGSFLSPYIGVWMYKVRNFKILLWMGAIVTCGSVFMMGYANALWQFYILGLIRGLVFFFLQMIPITILINNWFEKNVGMATSIVTSFSGIMGAIGTTATQMLIDSFGWQMSYKIYGLAAFLMCVPILIYPFALKPRSEGLQPYGHDDSVPKPAFKMGNRNFNKKQSTYIAFVIASVLMVSMTVLSSYFPAYAQTLGKTAALGSLMTSATMIGNVVSKLIFGVMADKIDAFKTTVLMLAINLISLVIITITHQDMLMIGAAFMFGTIFSMGAVAVPLLTRYFFGEENFNSAYGTLTFFTGIFSAVATTLVGYLYDFTGTYVTVFVMFIVFHLFIYFSLLWISRKTGKHVFHKNEEELA